MATRANVVATEVPIIKLVCGVGSLFQIDIMEIENSKWLSHEETIATPESLDYRLYPKAIYKGRNKRKCDSRSQRFGSNSN